MERMERAQRSCTWRVVRWPDSSGQPLWSFGSAVVVQGGWFSEALAGRSLVVTCAHVCSAGGHAERPRPLLPAAAAIDFCEGARSAGPRAVRRVVWQSPRDELDAVLLEVDELPPWSLAAAALMARPERAAALDESIVLRGYPMNQRAQLAREPGTVAAVQPPYLYYDVETGRGLSGAPIFAKGSGELLGLHRGDSRVLAPERALAPRHGIGFAQLLREARQAVSATR